MTNDITQNSDRFGYTFRNGDVVKVLPSKPDWWIAKGNISTNEQNRTQVEKRLGQLGREHIRVFQFLMTNPSGSTVRDIEQARKIECKNRGQSRSTLYPHQIYAILDDLIREQLVFKHFVEIIEVGKNTGAELHLYYTIDSIRENEWSM